MAGKSCLLRSTCVAVIMAQMGCYVTASSAVLAPVDAIFTRIGKRTGFRPHAAQAGIALSCQPPPWLWSSLLSCLWTCNRLRV